MAQKDLFGDEVEDDEEENETKRPNRSDGKSFHKQKEELRKKFKQFKVGMITEEDLTEKEKRLFVEYYGVGFEGDG